MLTNQLWMLQSIFLWIFKFLWTDNLYCEPSIFIVSYSTKSSHLRLCKERISIARSCITKQIRKAISFLFTGKLINCTQPSGSWAQVLYLLELFQGFSPRYGHLSPSRQSGMASEAFGSTTHGDPPGVGDHPVPTPSVTALSPALPSLHSDFSSQESPPISP